MNERGKSYDSTSIQMSHIRLQKHGKRTWEDQSARETRNDGPKHEPKKKQHKPCQTQHTLFPRGLDHITSSRADVVQRLKMMEQCPPAESVLCP